MKVLLTGAYEYSVEQLNLITSVGYEITFIQDERIPLDIDVSEFEVIVCNGVFLYNDIKKFKKLKFIQLTSVGFDKIPTDYIKHNDIRLANARGVYSIPMAEWAILKVLEIYKKSKRFYKIQDEHKWEKERDLLELTDKTAAIIGFGDVGVEIAKRLNAFGVNVIGIGRRKMEANLLYKYCLIDEVNYVLKNSDIVILALPLSEQTRHLIDGDMISSMKDKSVLVNISRGEVIDESALISFIQSGKFLGVALDVFENEPLGEDNILWNMENVIITPHNSFVSDKSRIRLFELIFANLSENIRR